MNVLAEIRHYPEFVEALRQRMAALNTTSDCIDEVGKIADGNTRKLIARSPIRTISRMSFGALLGTLGVKLLLVEDERWPAWMRAKVVGVNKRRGGPTWHTGKSVLARRKRKISAPFRDRAFAKRVRLQQLLTQGKRQRRAIARNAAVVRWAAVKAAATPAEYRADQTSSSAAPRARAPRPGPCRSGTPGRG